VPKALGEKALAAVIKVGLIPKNLAIKRDEENLFIPLIRQPSETEWTNLQTQLSTAELTQTSFEEKPQEKTFIQVLQEQLPSDLAESLPHAVDIIGDIAVLEIQANLQPYEKQIGQAILQTQKSVKTVLAKAGAINGVFRIRDYRWIAGENKTHTIHREYGCAYNVDIAKAYFSPDINKHKRVAGLVKARETVTDLFAGVGPFAVLIAKDQPQAKFTHWTLTPEQLNS
jgi:tRNA (guanine37-N1)-methyltransferase